MALPESTDQRWGPTPHLEDRCAPSQRKAGSPLRPRTPSRPVLRECARARVLVPRGGEEAPVLERAGWGTHLAGQRAFSPVPQTTDGPGEGALAERTRPAPPPGFLPGAARAGSPRQPRAPAVGPQFLGWPRWSAGQAAPPAHAPPRCATLPKLEAEPRWLHSRQRTAAAAKEAAVAAAAAAQLRRARRRPHGRAPTAGDASAGSSRRRSWRRTRRRRPAQESKVGAGGCARGPGGAVARAPARRTLAGRMGGGAPGPPPPAACASAQRRGRKAAGARPLGRCVAVGLRPGRSP